MGKILGILLIVVAIWVGLTIFNEGTDAAFGGLFASSSKDASDSSGRPVIRRVEASVSKAYRAQEERTRSNTEE